MSEEETTEPTGEIEAKLDELRADNMERLHALQGDGYGINPLMQLKLRLDTLTAMVMGEEALAGFELVYETLMAQEISEVESDIARRKLTEGISASQELR